MDISGAPTPDLSGVIADLSGVALGPADFEVLPTGKPHPVDEFAMDFYRIHDKMRLDFGDLISLKFQKERELKPKEKDVLSQLLKLRCDDFNDKVKSFWEDLDLFLQKM